LFSFLDTTTIRDRGQSKFDTDQITYAQGDKKFNSNRHNYLETTRKLHTLK